MGIEKLGQAIDDHCFTARSILLSFEIERTELEIRR